MVRGSTSKPPNALGADMLYRSAWSMASTTGRVRRRCASASAACARSSGAMALTLSTNMCTVTFIAIGTFLLWILLHTHIIFAHCRRRRDYTVCASHASLHHLLGAGHFSCCPGHWR